MLETSPSLIVVPSLVYPNFKLDIKQEKICKDLLIKQEIEWIEWFSSISLIPSVLKQFLWGASFTQCALIGEGRLIQQQQQQQQPTNHFILPT